MCGDSTGAALAAAVAQTFAAEKGPRLALQFLLCPILEHLPEIPSPLAAQPLEGLAAACIHTAESDPLRGQGAAYAARLERAGVRVIHRCHAGLTYLFDGMKAVIPCAASAFRLMGGDIRDFL